MADAGIIRNRLKVKAAIANAQRLREIRDGNAGLQGVARHASSVAEGGVGEVVQRTFVFTGGEIVGEFLLSTGYLPGAR